MKIAAVLLFLELIAMFVCYVQRARVVDYIGETYLDIVFTVAFIIACGLTIRIFIGHV